MIEGIIFDLNGTLIDIRTDEGYEEIYRSIAHFLTYYGLDLRRWQVRDAYFEIMDRQRNKLGEKFPEFDVLSVWEEFLRQHLGKALSPARRKQLSRFISEMYRGISRFRLQLYPEVSAVLAELRPRFKLAAVSDAQSLWAAAEMKAVGIDGLFDPVVISSDFGFRKPDRRLFEAALDGLSLSPEKVLFVGNDMYRDVYGAQLCGMKAVFFLSNQGKTSMEGVEPEYTIYNFGELRQAIEFFENRGRGPEASSPGLCFDGIVSK